MDQNFLYTKKLFEIPKNTIYLDGNSLGPPLKITAQTVEKFITEKWSKLLIKGWNNDNWITKPKNIGNRIANLIGAKPNTVIVGDTLSIKTYQALVSAIKLNPKRRVILSDSGNFPSDLYIARGLIDSLNLDYKLRIVDPEQLINAMSDEVAILLVTEVDFRTSRKHNMFELTKKAQELGIITVWNLAHSVGVLKVELDSSKVDFAIGCTYKYLNGGPGSPAFIYIAPKHHRNAENIIKGWLGHRSPFSFEKDFQAAPGIDKMQIGTPSIIAMVALEAALDIFDKITIDDVQNKSEELTQLFIDRIGNAYPTLELVSPTCPSDRGAHLAFRSKNGYAVIQSLIEHNVIGDFRSPDIIRFGFNPLFIDTTDVVEASEILTKILENAEWDRPEFKVQSFVT